MAVTIGFNHVAVTTADLDRMTRFYADAFEGVVTFEMSATEDHPRMAIIDLGGGAALNAFEVPAESIIGDRRSQGGRGPIDHYGLAVDSLATLERSAAGWSRRRRDRRDPAPRRGVVAVLPRPRRHGARGLLPRRRRGRPRGGADDDASCRRA